MLDDLRERYRAIRDRRDDVTLRIVRALSWADRGLAAKAADDPDAACIFFWIAFNAMYARRTDSYSENQEQRDFQEFLDKAKLLDRKGDLVAGLRACWDDAKAGLIDNRYVYKAFWTVGLAGAGDRRWQEGFERERQQVERSAQRGDYLPALRPLFDRLYVLRNQLHHGGSTRAGSLNRTQVEAGAKVMAHIIPVLIGVIIDNPDAGWGAPYYPPVLAP
ncbi:MAG: HEPN domain-containing protein [Chloroflexota bacterium]|nr:HEPN domain-containing protein [Chloroflexota bacterium]